MRIMLRKNQQLNLQKARKMALVMQLLPILLVLTIHHHLILHLLYRLMMMKMIKDLMISDKRKVKLRLREEQG